MVSEERESSQHSSETRATGPVGQGDYVVRQGDCMDSIAVEHGFFWETLWNLPENSELKETRGDPNVLLPGDRVHVPELRQRDESCASESTHRFRRRGVPSELRIRILRNGEPRANQPWVLDIDGRRFEGQTDGDGWMEQAIPANAQNGRLTVGDPSEDPDSYPIEIGRLDPVDELTGVQHRLASLGYECQRDGEWSEQTESAVSEFQEDQELEVTGQVDQETRDKLVEVYGR